MRVLCLGLDGADHGLVGEQLARGRLPTISRVADAGTFGVLRSTLPAFTPTAWSSLVTGLNPGGHGVFGFSDNPNRAARLERRGGTPLWRLLAAAGLRSVFVTVPFTFPPDGAGGIMVSGFGGPQSPEIAPASAAHRIRESHPDLLTAVTPTGWWEDVSGFADRLCEHADSIADVCMLAMELEPDMSLLCVDFMSSDIAGHLFWHRLDQTHPAHSREQSGDELLRVYEAVDRACGKVIDHAAWLYREEPTVIVLSDHGMRPIHSTFHLAGWLEEAGYLQYRADPVPEPRSVTGVRFGGAAPARRAKRLRRLLAHPELDDAGPLAAIDWPRTRAYAFGYGGQVYLAEHSRGQRDHGLARELRQALLDVRHPESGERAFAVMAKEELYHGPYLEQAPDLVVVPRDDRLFVDSTPIPADSVFERHESLTDAAGHVWSGQHVRDGILAAAGPGIVAGTMPDGVEITQIAATLLALHGLDADLESPAIEPILDHERPRRLLEFAAGSASPQPAVYTADEEVRLGEHLRALGYE